ncbi:MAG TPA: hypothetical protein VFM25_03705 [Verrucomicrobiae bacterium]|nr:hypothetical protein [Verrucomicrobiae bacterium]
MKINPRFLPGITLVFFACAVARAQTSPTTNSVTASSLSAYTIDGQSNPTLTLQRGVTYVFQVNASIHPFYIKTALTTGSGDQFTEGVINNGVTFGELRFTVPADAPDTLFYHCANHSPMGGTLNIVSPPTPPTVKIVYLALSQTNVVIKSTGASDWSVIPEYSSNLTQNVWTPVSQFDNTFANGTNTTTFDRLDPICGPNVFLRVRNQQN